MTDDRDRQMRTWHITAWSDIITTQAFGRSIVTADTDPNHHEHRNYYHYQPSSFLKFGENNHPQHLNYEWVVASESIGCSALAIFGWLLLDFRFEPIGDIYL